MKRISKSNFFLYKGNFFKFQKKPFLSNNNSKSNDNEPSFLEMVQLYFDNAAKHIDIPQYYLNLIKSTKSAIKFNFPLVKDDGTIQVIQGYRAQHSLHYLPTKGGTRYAEHIGKYPTY
jgi:glutamate dehydrogenase (NAD(P)+)